MNGLNCSYAEFIEAMNKGQVLADARSKGIERAMPLPEAIRHRDFNLTSYDFGHLLDECHPDFLGEDRLKKSVPTGPRLLEATASMEKSAYILWYEGKRRIVTATPKGSARDFEIDAFSWYASLNRWLGDGGSRDWALYLPVLCWSLLQNPDIKYEMGDEPMLVAINRRQRTRGKKPLRATNIIRLTKVEKIGEGDPKPPGNGTHASPIPHDRRGFTYTRKNGRQVTVRGPIAVK